MKIKESEYDISVIMPTYNRSNLLEYSLRSLAMQDIDRSTFEVVIGDDGSSDDTREVIRPYEDRINIQYVWQEDKGYRPASARNNALKLAKGKICLFIDSGIMVSQDCLRRHIEFHEEAGPDKAAIGYVYGFDHVGEAEVRLRNMINIDDPAASILEIGKFREYHDVRNRHYIVHNDRVEDMPAPWAFFWSGHISLSRENLFKVGLFDEQFDGRWGAEDIDLGYRVYLANIEIRLLRNASCIHYPHNTEKTEKEVQGLENVIYFNSKYRTPETEMYLKCFTDPDYLNVNEALLQMKSSVENMT